MAKKAKNKSVEGLMTVSEAAKMLNTTAAKIRWRVSNGEIEHTKIGKVIFLKADDVKNIDLDNLDTGSEAKLEGYLSMHQLAEELGVSYPRAHYLVKVDKRFGTPVKLSRYLFVEKKLVDDYLKSKPKETRAGAYQARVVIPHEHWRELTAVLRKKGITFDTWVLGKVKEEINRSSASKKEVTKASKDKSKR